MLKYFVIFLILGYTNGTPPGDGTDTSGTNTGYGDCAYASVPPSAPHRDDYRYTPDVGAHKLHTERANWEDARKICEGEDGHLAIINSDAEVLAITKIFNESKPDGLPDANVAYLGFNDRCNEGEFITIHGQTIAQAGFAKWETNEPNNHNDNQDCGAIYRNGKLHDVDCNTPLAFFCELPL